MKRIIFTFISLLLILPHIHTLSAADKDTREPVSEHWYDAPFRTDDFRYQNLALVPRVYSSFFSMNMGVFTWEMADWVGVGIFGIGTIVFMLPLENSLDVRLQEWIKARNTPATEKIFPIINTKSVLITLGCIFTTTYSLGLLLPDDKIFEMADLMLEATAIAWFYHFVFKMALGREGPNNGDGKAVIHGPKKSMELFPAGTPSGHIANWYAVSTVAAEYWDSNILRVISHSVGIYYSISLVYNNQHFLSDVIWGVAIGYYVGKWIVKHRSSKFSYRKNKDGLNPGRKTGSTEFIIFPGYDYVDGALSMNISYSLYF